MLDQTDIEYYKASQFRQRVQIKLHGLLHGVGFTHFAFRLAKEIGLEVGINNSAHGVLIEANGDFKQLQGFITRLWDECPTRANIQGLESTFLDTLGHKHLKTSTLEMEGEMIGLYHSIDSLLPDFETRVIQFIGSNEGEGTSTIVREFGKVVAEKFEKSVLVLDTDRQQNSQVLFYYNKSGNGTKESFFTDQTFNFMNTNGNWEKLRQKFDFILVDSLAATTSSSGLAFSRKVDGVVLVLEAEKTRWQVVESVKDKIIKHGGKILGVVLNKRKYYIPEYIYKRI